MTSVTAESVAEYLKTQADATCEALRSLVDERFRQIKAGHTAKDDDTCNDVTDLARAAAAYAASAAGAAVGLSWAKQLYPWGNFVGHAAPRRDLEIAGALVLAAIEYLDRASIRRLKQKKRRKASPRRRAK